MSKNLLYYGDNLDVLRRHVKDETVDLVYLDPPFNSDANYNVLFAAKDGTQATAQIQVFEDTWRWDEAAARQFAETVEAGGPVADVLLAFERFLGTNDMLSYLAMMAPRIVELRRVIKPTGSLYLHCDPTASHYLKLLLDAVFGPAQFRNEIIWRRTAAHSPARSFGPIHDTLLFYSKTDDYFFDIVRGRYMKGHVDRRYKPDSTGRLKFTSGGNVLTGSGATGGESGKPWMGVDPSAKNRHWAIPGFLAEQMPADFAGLGVLAKLDALYAKGLVEFPKGTAWPVPVRYLSDTEGPQLQDIWAYQPYTEGTVHGTDEGIDADVSWLGTTAPERLGYQTQKPVGLLERVIASSCPAEGVVLDPFCGCGTTIEAAQKLGRSWIGIDITHLATSLIKARLRDAFGDGAQYTVVGEPTTAEDAAALAGSDKYQFQWWALGLVGARPVDQKKGADRGIDGRSYLQFGGTTCQVIYSVKGGKLKATDVRDLRGVVERERADIGVLISFEPPTKLMRTEAARAGFYRSPWGEHPRLQILTVAELLEGKTVDAPKTGGINVTHRTAPRVTPKVPNTLSLFDTVPEPPSPSTVKRKRKKA